MAPHLIKLRSRNNNAFEHAEALSRSRAKRQEHRKFFVEGVPTIRQALTHGWSIDALYYAGDVELSSFARKVLDRSTARRHFELPTRLFESLRWSRKQEKSSEIIALIAMPPEDLSRIPVNEDSVVVVFDRPSDHGNLGTIIRTCEAFGAAGLIITGHAVDLYDPQTVRASMSSLFSLPVVRLSSHREVQSWANGIRKQHPSFPAGRHLGARVARHPTADVRASPRPRDRQRDARPQHELRQGMRRHDSDTDARVRVLAQRGVRNGHPPLRGRTPTRVGRHLTPTEGLRSQ